MTGLMLICNHESLGYDQYITACAYMVDKVVKCSSSEAVITQFKTLCMYAYDYVMYSVVLIWSMHLLDRPVTQVAISYC